MKIPRSLKEAENKAKEFQEKAEKFLKETGVQSVQGAKQVKQKLGVEIVIESYKNADCTQKSAKPNHWSNEYVPTSMPFKFSNKYTEPEDGAPIGIPAAERKFKSSKATSLTLSLEIIKPIFDLDSIEKDFKAIGGGKSLGENSMKKLEEKYVKDKIKLLHDVAFAYDGTIHEPNYLEITYGDISFIGRCDDLSFTYKQFDRKGHPWQASVSMAISEEKTLKKLKSELKISSPDLTHHYSVQYGETLTSISNKFYGSPSFYLELARANKLNGFRKLPPGTKLIIPPIKS